MSSILPFGCCLNGYKAVVEVSQRAVLVLRLFDWDRTSDDESLGRLGNPIFRYQHTSIEIQPRKQKQIILES